MCIRLYCGYSSQTLTKVIAYCEITIYLIGIILCMLFGALLEGRPDLLKNVIEHKPTENRDIILLLQLPHSVQTCFTLWIFTNFLVGLIFSFILLQGAQERNLSKVRIWFVVTILGYVLWLPIIAFWILNTLDPVNVLFLTLLSYIFGSLCLCVTYSFIDELRIEAISHRPGYKSHFIAFDKI